MVRSGIPAAAARLLAGAVLLLATGCGGGGTPTSPSQSPTSASVGAARIVTVTTGKTLDPDGYTATVDGGSAMSLSVNDTLVVTDLNAGTHLVDLGGIASNCAVAADNPLSVAVTAGDTVDAAFAVSCQFALRNQVLFTSNRDGNDEIYVMDADGSHETRLTFTSDALELEARPSPDGTRIVFDLVRGAIEQLYTMNADGSDTTQLTHDAALEESPAWSPDGSKIAFDDDGIEVMNADGSGVTRLSSTGYCPYWSPDGSKIVLCAPNQTSGKGDIYTMRPDGTGLQDLTNDPNYSDSYPVYSPDGSRIAFVRFPSDSTAAIWIMNADGSSIVQLTSSSEFSNYPSWSPDGSRIFFYGSRGGVYDVYSMKPDGTGLIDLTNEPADDVLPSSSRE